MASIGSVQLDRLKEFSEARKFIAKYYDSLFVNHSRINVLKRDYDSVIPHIYVVKIKELKKIR